MNTGGKAVLSTSFLNASDSIHKNTRIAGEISANTASAKPIFPAIRRNR